MKEYTFEAQIKASEIGSGGAYVEFPFDVETAFGTKGRVKIKCEFESVEYRGSLVKMGTSCHIIGITKDIRAKIGKHIGDFVRVKISADLEDRTVEIHPLLQVEFDKNSVLKVNFEKLSYTNQKETMRLLESAKKEETLLNRLDKIIEKLNK